LFAQPGSPDALSKAVLQLANDPVQARQMGANGRDYVHQHFNRARLAENLMDLLEDMRREYA
jgi:glycosyltransferase involved in cell wall biosynthesis